MMPTELICSSTRYPDEGCIIPLALISLLFHDPISRLELNIRMVVTKKKTETKKPKTIKAEPKKTEAKKTVAGKTVAKPAAKTKK
ncbi:MAG: hypothetical protein LUQ66_07895 [Methanoregula sp.]|nr:hypothetical protein [Methanoregula sp.]